MAYPHISTYRTLNSTTNKHLIRPVKSPSGKYMTQNVIIYAIVLDQPATSLFPHYSFRYGKYMVYIRISNCRDCKYNTNRYLIRPVRLPSG